MRNQKFLCECKFSIRNENNIIFSDDIRCLGFFCSILYKSKKINVVIAEYNNSIKEYYDKNKKISIQIDWKPINPESRTIYFSEKYKIMIIEIKKDDNIDNNRFLEFDNSQPKEHSSIYILTKSKISYIYSQYSDLVLGKFLFTNFEDKCNCFLRKKTFFILWHFTDFKLKK